MKRVLLSTLLLVAVLFVPVHAAYRAFEQITVAGSAIGFTAATVSAGAGHPQALFAVCRVETAPIRYRFDGGTQTSTVGTFANPGDVIPMQGADALQNFLAIRVTSTSGQLDCTYSDEPILPLVQPTGNLDGYGALFARSDHPNRISCVVTVSTATTIQAVGGSCAAPGAGLSLYVTDIEFSTSAAGIAADAFPTLKTGTGGTCGTGTAVVWQALTAAAGVFVSNSTIPIKLPANSELCWITSTAGSKALQIRGFIAP
jgi:hypothetical protein